jgi:hypothetical protein
MSNQALNMNIQQRWAKKIKETLLALNKSKYTFMNSKTHAYVDHYKFTLKLHIHTDVL